jgi:hypothetical protein
MTLILSVVILLTASVGTLLLSSGLYGALTLAGVSVGLADGIAYALMGVLAVFGLLPLVAGCYRLTCLEARRACLEARRSCLTARQGCPSAGEAPNLLAVDESPELWGLFQPFTSLRAYGRALAVGLEWLGWGLAVFGIPALCFRISSLLRSVSDAVSDVASDAVSDAVSDAAGGTVSEAVLPFLDGLDPAAAGILAVMIPLAGLLLGLLALLLSGRRAGFAYLAFIHAPLSLGEVNRYFKGFRRGILAPLALRLSLLGWVALSVVAVLVPFVLHTIPYALCCSAVYGAGMTRK